MLKKFFVSVLGSMTAIWLSILLLVILALTATVVSIGSLSSGLSSVAKAEIKKESVLMLDLEGTVNEYPTTPKLRDAIYGKLTDGHNLNEVVAAIYRASHDSRIKGLYIKCGGVSAGVASLQAIEEAITYFKSQPDKWVIAYGDSYAQSDYYLASGAEELWLNPQGAADIHGLGGITLFYTGLLEKLGVRMQILRVGTFKSAVEPYMLKEMSPASRMQQQVYLNSMWQSLRDRIAANRSVSPEEVDRWADEMTFTMPADSLKSMGIVTRIGYRHEAEEEIAARMKKDKFSDVNTVKTGDYVTAIDMTDYSYLPEVKAPKKESNTIAVLYAVGEITDMEGGGIVGDEMVGQIFDLAEDSDNLAGLILRVNSPGGSAFASEQIWEALQQFKERTGLPLYVSMGDVAASGGYYISCGADVIYAQPTTLTGSIGIFGMIPDIHGLMDKHLGVTTSKVLTNRNADFPNLFGPMTPEQQTKMQAYIERGYDTFTRRCAEGRHMSQDSIKAIAEGRVWDGSLAREIGLVDRLGSLRSAITGMASDLGLSAYRVVEYPETKHEWWEELLTMQEISESRLLDEETYNLYRRIEQIKNAPRIQCRMEDIVVE